MCVLIFSFRYRYAYSSSSLANDYVTNCINQFEAINEVWTLTTTLSTFIQRYVSYSYITVGVEYLCYYTSPRRSQGRVSPEDEC